MPEQAKPAEPNEASEPPPTPEEQQENLSVQEEAAKERAENRGYQ